MFSSLSALVAPTLLLAAVAIAGCASEDRRLAEDQQTCLSMGHSSGTAEFNQCMNELDLRRCATRRTKQGVPLHQATLECTRLGPSSAGSP
jgi:hypothetical protein